MVAAQATDKDFVLAVDGKKVAMGLNDNYGDIDLWGLESPPLEATKASFKDDIRLITELREVVVEERDETKLSQLTSQKKETLYPVLRSLAEKFSFRIKDLRELILSQCFLKKRLEKLSRESSELENKYKIALSKIAANVFKSKHIIKKTLTTNHQLCVFGSIICDDRNATDESIIDMAKQGNIIQLKEPENLPLDYRNESHLVKQRTEQWHSLRSQAPVTGSSMHNALGFRRLKDQNDHIKAVGTGSTREYPPEILARLQHGIDNENNALATVASYAIPFLLPGQNVYEEGARFITHDGVKLIEVSSDGSLRDANNRITHVLEIKCPIPIPEKLPVLYNIPVYYVCQVMAEMASVGCDKGLFVSYNNESTSVIEVSFDADLWEMLLKETSTIYSGVTPILRRKKSENVPIILQHLKKFPKEHCKLLLEVPSATCSDSENRTSLENSPYLFATQSRLSDKHTVSDLRGVLNTLIDISKETRLILRRKASEVLGFIITDTDRMPNKEIPHHIPIAYAMKGSSLKIKELRQMCEKVRNKCFEAGINIVCESYDGQWHGVTVRDTYYYPLTRLELQKDVWRDVLRMPKQALISHFKQKCVTQISRDGSSIDLSVISITRNCSGGLIVSNKELAQVQTPAILFTNKQTTKDHSTAAEQSVSTISLTASDVDKIRQSFATTTGKFAERLRTGTIEEISSVLNAKSLNSLCTKPQLLCLAQALSHYEPLGRLKSSMIKSKIVNEISRYIGDQSSVSPGTKQRMPMSLKQLACKVLSSKLYSKETLAAAYATAIYEVREKEWESSFPCPIVFKVNDREIRLFSRPEYNTQRKKCEVKVIDPSHLLVNNRTAILSKGMSQVKSAEFAKVCDTHPDVINRALVVDIIDKQNVAYAQKVFSKEVEQALTENVALNEANYVHLIREWYEAIDTPGIPSRKRLDQLINFRQYLLENVHFNHFPPPGIHVKGISTVQFTGFVQNVDMRILLYSLTKKGTYNHRSIGTLAVESFFSDLSYMSPNDCPKAISIPKMIAHVTEINHFKHDQDNGFV